MKNFVIIFVIGLLVVQNVSAQEQIEHKNLTVNITGLHNDKGTVRLAIYNAKGKWMKENIDAKFSEINHGKAQVVFENLPEGEYAISTFHDINANEDLDANFTGIPKEPYAFSNDAKGMFGPASWGDSKFTIASDLEIIINFKQ